MMSDNPEIECPDCNGEGFIRTNGWAFGPTCHVCTGRGWRAMTDDELSDAAETQEQRRYEDFHDGGGQPSLDEQHRAAWAQKQELK